MVKEEDILEAYQNCLSGKASSPDAIRFIVNLFENITDLTEAINSRTYEPLPSITFVVSRPVYREVFAANFRDRVIHHYIALRLEPLFEGVFSDRTFNCRKGKGQLYGVRQLAADIKECSHDFTRPCWYVKCDMKKATQVNVMHCLSNQSANMKNTLEEELREDSSALLLVNLSMPTRMGH